MKNQKLEEFMKLIWIADKSNMRSILITRDISLNIKMKALKDNLNNSMRSIKLSANYRAPL